MKLVDRRILLTTACASVVFTVASLKIERTIVLAPALPGLTVTIANWGWPLSYVKDDPVGHAPGELDAADAFMLPPLVENLVALLSIPLYTRGLYGVFRRRLAPRQLVGAAVLAPVVTYVVASVVIFREVAWAVAVISYVWTLALGLPASSYLIKRGWYSARTVIALGFVGGTAASLWVGLAPFTAFFGALCAAQFVLFANVPSDAFGRSTI